MFSLCLDQLVCEAVFFEQEKLGLWHRACCYLYIPLYMWWACHAPGWATQLSQCFNSSNVVTNLRLLWIFYTYYAQSIWNQAWGCAIFVQD